jgi:hypothetical protein
LQAQHALVDIDALAEDIERCLHKGMCKCMKTLWSARSGRRWEYDESMQCIECVTERGAAGKFADASPSGRRQYVAARATEWEQTEGFVVDQTGGQQRSSAKQGPGSSVHPV